MATEEEQAHEAAHAAGVPNDQPAPHGPTADAIQKVNDLHADELANLVVQRFDAHVGWWRTIVKYISAFLGHQLQVWTQVALMLLSFKLDFWSLISVIGLSAATSVVLFVFMIWCIFAQNPIAMAIYFAWSKRFAKNRGLVNALDDMFADFTDPQWNAAKAKLAGHPPARDPTRREFDLDVAKCLLQLASLMYERKPDCLKHACDVIAPELPKDAENRHEGAPRVGLLASLIGDAVAKKAGDALHAEENAIHSFTSQHGLIYLPASELNTLSSAYCALFYDPNSNWIVVAFKGTSPTEYDEWVTDFNILMKPATKWIESFSKAHGGFLERIFPESLIEGSKRPYETISESVSQVANSLLKNLPRDEHVNVWFTGHSLGCATASITYSRALARPEWGERVLLRDAYLFAAPITTDIGSSEAFNAAMASENAIPRTMWRITNGKDAVATALPDLGDSEKYRSRRAKVENDYFMFCHLGTELKMKSRPHLSQVKTLQFEDTVEINVVSSFSPEELERPAKGAGVSWLVRLSQKIPIVGRVIQHGTVFYWDQLIHMKLGSCEHIH